MQDKAKCKSKIVFGDDFGDNSATFRCQLLPGHDGLHEEIGSLYNEQSFKVTWDWPRQQPLEYCIECAQNHANWLEEECKLIDEVYKDTVEAEHKKQRERDTAAEMIRLIEKSKALGDKFDSNDFDDEYEEIIRKNSEF